VAYRLPSSSGGGGEEEEGGEEDVKVVIRNLAGDTSNICGRALYHLMVERMGLGGGKWSSGRVSGSSGTTATPGITAEGFRQGMIHLALQSCQLRANQGTK